MSDRENRDARLAGRCMQDVADIQRCAFQPGRKARRSQQVVQSQHQSKAILGRIKRLELQHADAADRWGLHLLNQNAQVQIYPFSPGGIDQRRKQHMLAALNRVGFDPNQAQQTVNHRADPVPHQIAVIDDRRVGSRKRLEDRNRQPGAGPGSINGKIRGVAQALNAVAVLTPIRQTLAPGIGLLRGIFLRRQTFLAGIILVDPRQKVFSAQLGESQQEVAQVALGIN